MAEFYPANLSCNQNQNDSIMSYTYNTNHNNGTKDHDNGSTDYCSWYSKENIVIFNYIFISIYLPLSLVAIYSLYTQIKNDHVGPIYAINLLISDLIQLCYIIDFKGYQCSPTGSAYKCAVIARIDFVVCVALERYLAITNPLWYQDRQTIKISVMVCFFIWFISILLSILNTLLLSLLLLHLPLLLFILIGTFKALSAAISVPSDEKRRTVAILVVVLSLYLITLLPELILNIFESMFYLCWIDYNVYHKYLNCINILVKTLSPFQPLADLVLNFFNNKWVIDKLVSHLRCCRKDSNGINISQS